MRPAGVHSRLQIFRWEAIGALFVSLAGSALHFAYEWSGEWHPLALVAAVNESVWEHLKLAFWPTLVYAAVEWPFVRKHTRNYLAGKAANLAVVPLVIVTVFYTYTAILGVNVLALDIGLFFAAVSFGHFVSYRILTARPATLWAFRVSIVLIVVETAAFCVFTFYPPNALLFRDPASHQRPAVPAGSG